MLSSVLCCASKSINCYSIESKQRRVIHNHPHTSDVCRQKLASLCVIIHAGNRFVCCHGLSENWISFAALTINKNIQLGARKWSGTRGKFWFIYAIIIINRFFSESTPTVRQTSTGASEFVHFYFCGNYKRKKWLIFYTYGQPLSLWEYRKGNKENLHTLHHARRP